MLNLVLMTAALCIGSEEGDARAKAALAACQVRTPSAVACLCQAGAPCTCAAGACNCAAAQLNPPVQSTPTVRYFTVQTGACANGQCRRGLFGRR